MAGRQDQEIFFWLALSMAPGVGAVRFGQLLERFKTPEAVFRAPERDLASLPRLPRKTIAALKDFSWNGQVEEELNRARRLGCKLIKLNDPDYPPRLKEIRDPPPVLWVKGDIIPRDRAAVALVGSRAASSHGLRTADRLAEELVKAGVTVVSGLAVGIDAAAHRGALKAGGRTMAVLGCGVDVIYPASNRDLHEQIPESGSIISEFPLGTAPEPGHFPSRNRIIAGLSLAVVVVEAAAKSGALITARLALEENREVMAVPGLAGSPKSQGVHHLIRQGAALVETGREIIEEIAPQVRNLGVQPFIAEKKAPLPAMASEEKSIWDALGPDSLHVDHLGRMTGLAPARLVALLLDMEIKGLIEQIPGMRYTRKR